MKDIKQVYNGLPEDFNKEILWVLDIYRTNHLSHTPGGSDVIVEYHQGEVLGYDRIKFPSKYISKFWRGIIIKERSDYDKLSMDQQLSIVKSKICRIFARKYNLGNINSIPFEEVWNYATSENLPWKALEKYDFNFIDNEIKAIDKWLDKQELEEDKAVEAYLAKLELQEDEEAKAIDEWLDKQELEEDKAVEACLAKDELEEEEETKAMEEWLDKKELERKNLEEFKKKNSHDLALNTGEIYDALKKYYPTLLPEMVEEMEASLINIIKNEKLISNHYKSKSIEIIEKLELLETVKNQRLNYRDQSFYSDYFIQHNKANSYSLTFYNEKFVLKYSDYHEEFGLFFILKFTVLNPTRYIEYLEYHLENSFESNFHNYNIYLELIFLKYKNIIHFDYTRVLQLFKDTIINKSTKPSENTLSTNFQGLAFYYLFQALKIPARTKSAQARFIQLFTGKNLKAITESLHNPLKTKSPEAILSDLYLLRKHFDEMQLEQIEEMIKKDIDKIKNSK